MSEPLDYWDRRLYNWVLYYRSGSSLSGSSSLCMLVNTDRYWTEPTREIAVPGDAIDTGLLVDKLSLEHQQAIVAWYWWSGTKDTIAKQLGVHRKTLWQRIRDAKLTLRALQILATKRAENKGSSLNVRKISETA